MLGLLLACAAHVPPSMEPGEVIPFQTDDGWTLNLRHYPGPGKPVLLVHGMGANHYNWDYAPEISFADYLQDQGWDVWVTDLRGDRDVAAPSEEALRTYTFDDHALHDLPAAVDTVRAITGEDKLYWVGHSMGGMLLYTALTAFPEKIAAGVAIAAPASMKSMNAIHRAAKTAGWLVPKEGTMHNLVWYRLSRAMGRANPLYGILSNKDNLDWPTIRGLGENGLENMSRAVAKQAHTWLREEEFTTVGGQRWPQPSDVPVLVLAGSVDRVAPAADVQVACTYYSDCTYRLLGVETGFSTDYGHVDPVVGVTARTEVYPIIGDFLKAHLPRENDGEPAVAAQ